MLFLIPNYPNGIGTIAMRTAYRCTSMCSGMADSTNESGSEAPRQVPRGEDEVSKQEDSGGQKGIQITQTLSHKLSGLQIPSLSAVAMRGDEKLVDSFLSECVSVEGSTAEVKQSQLYIASFWGFPDVVQSLLESGTGVNYQNKGTLWTPLHAAAFQEHGKVVMLLLQSSANPDLKDSEGRTAKDFASASQKIWPHFAALGCTKTSKQELLAKGIIRKVEQPVTKGQNLAELKGLRMVSGLTRPGSAYVIQDPATVVGRKSYLDSHAMAACLSGDVLAIAEESKPLTGVWKLS